MRSIIKKIKQRFLLKQLYKSGLHLSAPFSIYNISNLKFDPPIYIGPDCWMELRGNIHIGSGTIIGPRFKVHTSNHNYNGTMLPYDDKYLVKDITIGENVWIGSDVTILPGIKIGEGAVIGANAVVTKSVPALTIIGGNPAKVIKYRDSAKYEQLKKDRQIYLVNKAKGLTELDDIKRIINVSNNEVSH